MPIIWTGSGTVLTCVNAMPGAAPTRAKDGSILEHVMMRLPDCSFIGSVTPPVWRKINPLLIPEGPGAALQRSLAAQEAPARVHPETGIPVRIFRCSVCGYLEMYASQTIEPKLWGVDDGK
jgi:hypothetical protein